jgi:hypothetical protein
MEKRCLRFADISVSEKMLYSLFLMTIGIGYLFALTHMYYTHQMRDGQAGMSIQDVMIAYYGSQDQTRLGAAINGGPMEPNLKSANDKEKILAWLNSDKSKVRFEQSVTPILNSSCLFQRCVINRLGENLPYSFVRYRLYFITGGQDFYFFRHERSVETHHCRHSVFIHAYRHAVVVYHAQ